MRESEKFYAQVDKSTKRTVFAHIFGLAVIALIIWLFDENFSILLLFVCAVSALIPLISRSSLPDDDAFEKAQHKAFDMGYRIERDYFGTVRAIQIENPGSGRTKSTSEIPNS